MKIEKQIIPAIPAIYIVYFLVFWISSPTFAQNAEIDSLARQLRSAKGTQRLQLMNQLTLAYLPVDLPKALINSEEAVGEARKTGNSVDLGWASLYQSICRATAGDTRLAHEQLAEVFKVAKRSGDRTMHAYAHNVLANLLRDQGLHDSARYHYRQAETHLPVGKDPSFDVIAGLEITRLYIHHLKPDSALLTIEATLKMPHIQHVKSRKILAEAYVLRGKALVRLFRYPEAMEMLKSTYAMTDSGSNTFLRARVVEGEMRYVQGDFSGALEIWKAILNAEKSMGYKYDLANLLVMVGNAYEEQGFLRIAEQYHNSAQGIASNSEFHFIMGEALYGKAWISYKAKAYPLARTLIRDAEKEFRICRNQLRLAGLVNLQAQIMMARGKYDSSLLFHQSALAMREQIGDSYAISSSLFNLGELLNLRKEYEKALRVLRRGVRYDEAIGDRFGMGLYYYQIGLSLNSLNRLDSVEFYLSRAIENAVPSSSYDILYKTYFQMSEFMRKTGRPNEALGFLNRYIHLRDSLYNQESAQSLAAYETLLEVDQKEQQLELLKKDQALASANSRIQSILVYALGIGLLIMVLLAVVYYRITVRLRVLNRSNQQKADELGIANTSLKNLYVDIQSKNTDLQEALNRLQQAQEQLLRSEKMASLGVLAAGIAHELNNPLNFIKGSASNLEARFEKENQVSVTEAKEYLRIINEGVQRATSILSGLGQYSRQTDKMSEFCDVHKILENCLVILGNSLKYHVKVDKRFSEKAFFLTGNEGKLHQAFINIISNAEQSIVGDGRIWVITEFQGNDGVVIIRDTGCGIPKESLHRLGDLFFTTKEPGKGTGLGLSISYKIIQEHKGRIEVYSVVGQGTEFRLIFPGVR